MTPGRAPLLRRAGVSILSFALLLPAALRAQLPAEEDLQLMLRFLVEDGATPGVAFGVLDPDGTTRAVAYGSGGPGTRPVGTRTLFEIGDVTMTFTAAVLAEMVLRGEVGLEDSVATYLPDGVTVPSRLGREITLLDLATHTSGLPGTGETDSSRGVPGTDDPSDIEALYAFLSEYELRHHPGERRAHSEVGYGLLAHALARAAGMSYPELLRERVLEPLGMESTGYAPAGRREEWIAKGHDRGSVVSPTAPSEATQGASGLHSSVEDMLKFLRANVGPPQTGLERALRLAHEVRVAGRDGETGYGFSWRTLPVRGRTPHVTHGGGTPGFTAVIAFDPQRRTGTVLLANARAFRDRLGSALLMFDPPPEEWGVPPHPPALERYAGEYRSRLTRYFIRLDDQGFLTYQRRGLVRARLYPRSDSTFYLLRGPQTFTFQTNAEREVVGVGWTIDERAGAGVGRSRIARKVADHTPPPAVIAGNAGFWTAWGRGTWAVAVVLGALAVAAALYPLYRQARRDGDADLDRRRRAWREGRA